MEETEQCRILSVLEPSATEILKYNPNLDLVPIKADQENLK